LKAFPPPSIAEAPAGKPGPLLEGEFLNGIWRKKTIVNKTAAIKNLILMNKNGGIVSTEVFITGNVPAHKDAMKNNINSALRRFKPQGYTTLMTCFK
jgi:hypothetical protein